MNKTQNATGGAGKAGSSVAIVPTNVTHVSVKPPAPPVPRIETMKLDMVKDIKKLAVYFGGSKDEAKRFITASYEYVRRVPKLLECERDSLNMALLQAAYFRFMPSGVSGEAYIIPYGSEAKFQLGYQGIVTLIYRTEKVKSIKALIVYANEKFEYTEGLETTLVHVPAKFGEDRGEPIGVYAVSLMTNGGRLFTVMSKDDVMAIKNLSKAKDSKESPWNGDKDPQLWMWKKTCLIQLAKLLPKTRELQKAIEEDFKGEGMLKADLDAAGPAVGAASHKPQLKTLEIDITEPPFPGESIDDISEEDKASIVAQEKAEAEGDVIEM